MPPSNPKELHKYPRLQGYMSQIQELFSRHPEASTLWIGAGFSTYSSNLPTWSTFLKHCLGLVAPTSDRFIIEKLVEAGRMRLAAEYLFETLGQELFRQLQDHFSSTAIKRRLPLHRFTSSRIITTNYDSLVEHQLPWYEILSPLEPVTSLVNSGFQITKIHGTVSQPHTCILSSSSYARTYNDHFAWYLIHVFLTSSVVFIGSSMDKSEPYFQILRTIRTRGYSMPDHFALLSVTSSEEGKQRARQLEQLGIKVIPFIPDQDFNNFSALIEVMVTPSWTEAEYSSLLSKIRALIFKSRYLEAAVYLRRMLIDTNRPISLNREFCDLVNSLSSHVILKQRSSGLYRQLLNKGQDIGALMSDCANETLASASALDGFILCLDQLSTIDASKINDLDLMRGARRKVAGDLGIPHLDARRRWQS